MYYLETEKPRLTFTVIVFKISHKTYSHRCQCKQMRRNYVWITTALSLNGRIQAGIHLVPTYDTICHFVSIEYIIVSKHVVSKRVS